MGEIVISALDRKVLLTFVRR